MPRKFFNNILNLAARINPRDAALYSAVFAFFFFVVFYLTFPFDTIKTMMVTEIEAKTGAKVVMDSLKPLRMSGVEVHGFKMVQPSDPTRVLADVSLLRFRFHILPLFLARVIVDYDLIAYGGGLSGVMEARKGGRWALAVNFKDLDLQKYNFAKLIEKYGEMNLIGKLSGNFNVFYDNVNKRNSQGAVNLAFEGVQIAKAKILSKELPDVNFKPGSIKMNYAQGALTVQEWEMEGDNLALSMNGRVTLGGNLKNSRVALNLKAKPSETLIEKFGELAALKSPDSEGWYNVSLNGPLSSPKMTMR